MNCVQKKRNDQDDENELWCLFNVRGFPILEQSKYTTETTFNVKLQSYKPPNYKGYCRKCKKPPPPPHKNGGQRT